jgi:type II secretory pathway pseudopilin PulG
MGGKMGNLLSRQNRRGDTIVEVLIAIAVASFAIGTSYALASKSLQNAITASDRNHAVNIAQNQIADLKLRHATYNTEAGFNQDFGVPSSTAATPPYPVHGRDFCLLDGVALKGSPNWDPKDNTGIKNAANPETAADNFNNYDQVNCLRDGQYYVNVTAMVTSVSKDSSNNTVFRIAVRWPTIGGGANSQAVLYYRLNSGAGGGGGAAPWPPPPPPPPPSPPTACPAQSESQFSPFDPNGGVSRGVGLRAVVLPLSTVLPKGCSFNMKVVTWDEGHPDADPAHPNGQPHEQVWIEGFGSPVPCTSSDGSAADMTECTNVLFKTGLTDDIPLNRHSSFFEFSGITPTGDVHNFVFKHYSLYNPNQPVGSDSLDTSSPWYIEGQTNTANSVHGWCIFINPDPAQSITCTPNGYTGFN